MSGGTARCSRSAAIALVIVPLSAAMVERRDSRAHAFQQSALEAVREAFGHKGYVLLTLGFFVCGFQVVFVGVHLPSYLADRGMAPHVAVTALALVALFNIVGTYATGWLGSRFSKKYILSIIYFSRSAVFAAFFWLPLSEITVYAFAVTLGLLWLSTVPPTNTIVAQIFGVRYLAMLSGFTFFSHQVGSFLGAWLGGKLFDATGSYDVVWYLAMALGIVAGLLNLPIDERAIRRPAPPGRIIRFRHGHAAPRAALPCLVQPAPRSLATPVPRAYRGVHPMSDIVIAGALRTAIGKFGGALAKVPAPELGATVIRALLAQVRRQARPGLRGDPGPGAGRGQRPESRAPGAHQVGHAEGGARQ